MASISFVKKKILRENFEFELGWCRLLITPCMLCKHLSTHLKHPFIDYNKNNTDYLVSTKKIPIL